MRIILFLAIIYAILGFFGLVTYFYKKNLNDPQLIRRKRLIYVALAIAALIELLRLYFWYSIDSF